jgi:hypothetical protein
VPFHPDGAPHDNTERARRFARQLRAASACRCTRWTSATPRPRHAAARDLDAARRRSSSTSSSRTRRVGAIFHEQPEPRRGADHTKLPFEIDGRHIVLIDDVLYTGRTIRAVINELYDFGRPASVTLAVLVDRGGRELPIAAGVSAARIALPADQRLSLARDDAGRFSFDIEEGLTRDARRAQPAAQRHGELIHLLSIEGLPRDVLRRSSTPRAPSSRASTTAR